MNVRPKRLKCVKEESTQATLANIELVLRNAIRECYSDDELRFIRLETGRIHQSAPLQLKEASEGGNLESK